MKMAKQKKEFQAMNCTKCNYLCSIDENHCPRCQAQSFNIIAISKNKFKKIRKRQDKKQKKIEEQGKNLVWKPTINTVFLIDEHADDTVEVHWCSIDEVEERGDVEWYLLSESTTANTKFESVREAKAFIEGMLFATECIIMDRQENWDEY